MSASIGVALFYDGTPFSREGGVACAFRGEPFEFGGASDLSSKLLWVTNANLEDLVKAGLHKSPKIAHTGYFKARLEQIVKELGLGAEGITQHCAMLAELLGSTASMAKQQLGFTQFPLRGLAQGVGQLYGFPDCADGSAIQNIAMLSGQRYTACERRRRLENAEVFSFWEPRYEWAKQLLAEPLPNNSDLQVIPPHSLPTNGRNAIAVVEWAKENRIPLFANIKIHALEEDVGRLLNYGAGATPVSNRTEAGSVSVRNGRDWCALPELEVLVESGDVELLKVAMAPGWIASGLHVFENKLAPVSYSYGLVAENLWSGIMRRPDQSGVISKNLSTSWLQAVDRMRCLRVAERVGGLGMDVISYGNGRITVACPASVRNLIPQVAQEQGVLYPAALEGLKHYQPRKEVPMQVMQHLINSKAYSSLVEVNQLLLKAMQDAHEAQ